MNSTTELAVVTGGTDGIGREVALRLLQRGFRVIIVGRNPDKGQAATAWLQAQHPDANVTYWQYDLALMQQVRQLAERLKEAHVPLDVLVHCAGVMLRQRTLTEEGLETVFAVQYLARYLLTHAVIDLLLQSEAGRVVNVSAGGSINMALDFANLNGEKHYNGVTALKHESIANDMLMIDLQERTPQLRSYGYGPGYVLTDLLRDMPQMLRFFARTFGQLMAVTPQQAADEIIALLMDEAASGLYGRLYTRRLKHHLPSGFRADAANRQRLREISEQWVTGFLNY